MIWKFHYLICLLIFTSAAFSHKINILADVEGNTVFIMVYLSDGKPVKNCAIEVYDPANKKLLEGKTDEAGEFSFEIPVKTDLKIVADASMGHLVETVIKAPELPEIKSEKKPESGVPAPKIQNTKPPAAEQKVIDRVEMRTLISEVLDEKLRPISQRISRLEKKSISAVEIIGGIGYIFGLMGLLMYFRGLRKK